MSNEMVERVARAICAAQIRHPAVEEYRAMELEIAWEINREECTWLAEAAIAVMREPTEAMVLAAFRHKGTGDMVWQAMIDAALNEPGSE